MTDKQDSDYHRAWNNYAIEDWEEFDRCIRRNDCSVDWAAKCAGIAVYDALVVLEKQDPYLYEIVVMTGNKPFHASSTKRRLSPPYLRDQAPIGGRRKDYGQDHTQDPRAGIHTSLPGEFAKPSVEEVRQRYLTMLGDRDDHDRIDGQIDTGNAWGNTKTKRAVDPYRGAHKTAPMVKKKKKKKKKIKEVKQPRLLRCGHYQKTGHNRVSCLSLKQKQGEIRRPAGSI